MGTYIEVCLGESNQPLGVRDPFYELNSGVLTL